jgi:hypothetical protein
MNKFIQYVTFSNSSEICCAVKGAKTFTAMDHILFDHMKNFPRAVLLLRMYTPWIERNGCVLLCGMQTILLRLQYVYTHRLQFLW